MAAKPGSFVCQTYVEGCRTEDQSFRFSRTGDVERVRLHKRNAAAAAAAVLSLPHSICTDTELARCSFMLSRVNMLRRPTSTSVALGLSTHSLLCRPTLSTQHHPALVERRGPARCIFAASASSSPTLLSGPAVERTQSCGCAPSVLVLRLCLQFVTIDAHREKQLAIGPYRGNVRHRQKGLNEQLGMSETKDPARTPPHTPLPVCITAGSAYV